MLHTLKPLDCSLKPRSLTKIFFRSLGVAVIASVIFCTTAANATELTSGERALPN